MSDFERVSEETFRLSLEQDEATLLGRLLDEMNALLKSDLPRAEPVTGRLFPNAYESDDDQAAYEELVGDQLRSGKQEALEQVRKMLEDRSNGAIEMNRADVDAWLTVVNDLRLTIGTRLEVTEETMQRELDAGDPDAAALSVLHWLGWVQESILRQITS